MKRMLTKMLLFLLCLSMTSATVSLLSSCQEEQSENNGSKTDSTIEGENAPELPERNYNDDFICLTQNESDFWVEDASSGDIVDYAVYMRNSTVEDLYGIKIKTDQRVYYTIPDHISTLVKAGDTKSVDLVVNHIVYSSNIVVAGNAVDWYDVPYIDFTQDYWPATNINDLTLNGHNYMCVGDFALTTISGMFCMYFNKELVNKYQMGDIYGIVEDGDWTYAKMLGLVTNIYDDLNYDTTRDEKDLYGLVCASTAGNTNWLWGFDNPVFSRNETTGELECTFLSKKLPNIAENLHDLYYRTKGVWYAGDSIGLDTSKFVKGEAVFITGGVGTMTGALRDMNGWGIIPLPKYNQKQTEYKTMLGGGINALIIPKTDISEEHLEEVGVIVTALEYLSNKDVRPVYYDKALKGKYADSPKEAAMIDKINAGCMVDFGYIYMGFEGPSFELQRMLHAKNTNVSSSWQNRKYIYEDLITQAYEAFGLVFEGFE